MNPIPISSCYVCDQDTWKSVDKSKGEYKCRKCGRITNKILRRKKDGKENI